MDLDPDEFENTVDAMAVRGWNSPAKNVQYNREYDE